MHSNMELSTVLGKRYLLINFLPLRTSERCNLVIVGNLKKFSNVLSKRNRVRDWSEIGRGILGQV